MLREYAGTSFDPALVELLIARLNIVDAGAGGRAGESAWTGNGRARAPGHRRRASRGADALRDRAGARLEPRRRRRDGADSGQGQPARAVRHLRAVPRRRRTTGYVCRYAHGPGTEALFKWTPKSWSELSLRLPSCADGRGAHGEDLTALLPCPLTFEGRLIGGLVIYHTVAGLLHRRAPPRPRPRERAGRGGDLQLDALRADAARIAHRSADRAAEPALARSAVRGRAGARRAHARAASASSCSTSIGSRRSTTPTATRRAIARCARSAPCCASTVRQNDLCARFAGDEFVVVLWDCSPEHEARRVLELQTAVSAHPFEPRPGVRVSLSISAGAAALPGGRHHVRGTAGGGRRADVPRQGRPPLAQLRPAPGEAQRARLARSNVAGLYATFQARACRGESPTYSATALDVLRVLTPSRSRGHAALEREVPTPPARPIARTLQVSAGVHSDVSPKQGVERIRAGPGQRQRHRAPRRRAAAARSRSTSRTDHCCQCTLMAATIITDEHQRRTDRARGGRTRRAARSPTSLSPAATANSRPGRNPSDSKNGPCPRGRSRRTTRRASALRARPSDAPEHQPRDEQSCIHVRLHASAAGRRHSNYIKYSDYMSRSTCECRSRSAILIGGMKDTAAHAPELCARFHRASELIGRRWTGAIIFVLLKSRCRFATLRDAIPDITDRMLSDRLQELEQEGIVERTVVPETPVRVEYALTKKGRALAAGDRRDRGLGAQVDRTRDGGKAGEARARPSRGFRPIGCPRLKAARSRRSTQNSRNPQKCPVVPPVTLRFLRILRLPSSTDDHDLDRQVHEPSEALGGRGQRARAGCRQPRIRRHLDRHRIAARRPPPRAGEHAVDDQRMREHVRQSGGSASRRTNNRFAILVGDQILVVVRQQVG